jgi:hypothetical protein
VQALEIMRRRPTRGSEAAEAHSGGILVDRWARRCACLLAAFAIVLLCCVSHAAASETRYVDGVSDLSMPDWDGGFSASSFHSFFNEAWVQDGHIKFARFAVQWNVLSNANYKWEREQFEAWVRDAASMHLSLDLVPTTYNDEIPAEAEYKQALAELLATAKGESGGASIAYVEPWNEPNAQGEMAQMPSRAAEFALYAHEVCGGYGCTIVAGNFEDTTTSLGYAESYVGKLKELKYSPEDWGIHPYKAVESGNDTKATELAGYLRGKYGSGTKIWITEVGTRQCKGSERLNEVQGGERADYIVNTLMPALKPEHVFYWEFLFKDNESPECGGSETDDALYVPSGETGAGAPADRPRPAAAFIYDGEGFPWGYTGGASEISSFGATLTATIYTGGLRAANYKAVYAAEGGMTEESKAGTASATEGGSPVSMSIGGLVPETVYHYHVVAFNGEGHDPGAEDVFRTLPRTSPVVVRDPSTGYQWVYYVGADGNIWGRYYHGPEWETFKAGSGEPAAPGTSPVVVRDPSTGYQWVYYVGADGNIWGRYYHGPEWETFKVGMAEPAGPGTGLTMTRDESTGYDWTYYIGQEANIWGWTYNGPTWQAFTAGGGEPAR